MHEPALHADPIAWLQAHPLRPMAPAARWCVLAGLARRAAGCDGALRALLLDKLQARLNALAPLAAGSTGTAVQPAAPLAAAPSLASLREALAQGRGAPDGSGNGNGSGNDNGNGHGNGQGPAAGHMAGDLTDIPLRALQAQPRSWTGLRMAQRMAAIQANASAAAAQPLGPLNAHALVPRTLGRLQALSPAYLQQLLAHVDALAALGSPVNMATNAAGAVPAAATPPAAKPAASPKRTARGRPVRLAR